MELAELLSRRTDDVLTRASESVARSHLASYEKAGPDLTRERLGELYGRLIECVRGRRLDPIRDYGKALAEERFRGGYHLLEVQTAVNVLEEAVWQIIASELPAESYASAFAMTSTVLGAAKDSLACNYVRLATHTRAPCLDVSSLFQGTDEHGASD